MTLTEFRKLTAHLAGERQLLSAGAPIKVLWHDEADVVSVDDEAFPLDDDATVLAGTAPSGG